MSPKNFRLLLIGILGASIVVFLVSVFAGLSVLSKKSQAMVSLKIQEGVVTEQVTNLLTAKKEVEKYAYFNDIARAVIPSDKNQAQAIADLVQLAEESGFSLQSITFPTSTLGARAAGSASAAGAVSSSSISQAKPIAGMPGLYSVQITVAPAVGSQVPANKQVTYSKLIDFLQKLERNRRTAQINEVNIQPEQNGQYINFSVQLNVFVKP